MANTFITKADYAQAINNNILDAVIKFDDNRLDVAEDSAIELMMGYLNNRYDTDAIFSATGSDRNPVILMYAIDIALYQLHSLINYNKIPAFREKKYDAAISWLERVASLEINPPSLPKVADDTSRNYVIFGGNTKRDNSL